jgi:hypothetical protein
MSLLLLLLLLMMMMMVLQAGLTRDVMLLSRWVRREENRRGGSGSDTRR